MVNKNKLTKTLGIFLLLTVLILNVTMVSALEFDNVKSYDAITREVTIHNSFLGIKTSEVGKARLNTPLNLKVAPGYQKVAEFDLWAYEDYNDALKQFTFTDLKKKEKINRDYDLKYFNGMKNITVDIYGCKDKEAFCSNGGKIGTELVEIEDWVKITPADLKKNEKLTVGVFTEVKIGDYVDWIPIIYGVGVKEWASWTADMNVDILSYWKFDDDVLDELDLHNGTWTSTPTYRAGIINNGIETAHTVPRYVTLDDGSGTLGFTDESFTVSIWYNQTDWSNVQDMTVIGTSTNGGWAIYIENRGEHGNINFGQYGVNEVSSTDTITVGTLQNIIVSYDQTANEVNYYLNGVIDSGGADGYSTEFTDHDVGIAHNGAGTYTNAIYDEGSVWVNRVLTPTEALAVYNAQKDGLETGQYTTEFDKSPNITLNLPTNHINYTTSPLQINFSCYGSDDINLTSVGLYINGSLDQLNASGINNTNYTFSKTLTEGLYNWTCEGTDNESQTTKPTERIFRIHTTSPNATIHYPIGTFNYHLSGNPLTLNWTVEEPGENLTTHIINCTYTYNGVITEINNTVCTQLNQTTFIPVAGVNTINFTVTDEFGLESTNSTTWNIKVFEINQTYNNETTEGSLETFLANIRLGSGYSISGAVLINYNGTEDTGQSFESGSNTVLRKTDLLIPNVATDTNVTFYWNITLSDLTNLNLTSKNQTIYNLNVDNCSSNTVELFNFSVVDEELQTALPNATIEIAINIYDQLGETLILNYSNLFKKINPLRICINRNISSDSFYSVDTIVRYEDTGNANEYYNIVNQTLTNGTETQKITLYDLNLTDSTDFQLSFTGSDFLPIENALVYVDRQYISENKFKTVELPKTDYNGQSVLHLVRNEVIYNIKIIKDGVVLGNFENLVAFCDDFTIGDCNIELNAFDSIESVFNFDEELGIIYTSPVYNETANTISFNFLTDDGTAKTVSLNVTRNDIFGNRSICNSTLTSSGGTLTCNIDPNIDESVLMVSIYVDGVLAVFGSVELDTDNFGVAGYLVMFVMAMSFIFMFSGSKTGVLISLGLTFAGALGMGIISGNLIGVGASGIWILVIIFVGIYKLNKDRNA